MKQLIVQVQPDLDSALDMVQVRSAMSLLAAMDIVAESSVDEGEDGGPYVNFSFWCDDVATLWRYIRAVLDAKTEFGRVLKSASMVMCEGDRGWDDYLLLHHFDPVVELDEALPP
jgi:hypothetical protein